MKIWKITCCKMCPKIGKIYNVDGSFDYCYREHRYILDINKLSYWCTLPDYKEKDNENNKS